jgi:uncharacterized protein YjiS (DUF1127 family)
MSLFTIVTSACNAFLASLREQACVELLVVNDHMLADLGLRRADLRGGLWQPWGMVDGDPPASPRPLHASDFDTVWPLF